ncbi:MAG: bifunctional adenosylcobinamide kinase/adenosylcobinamide-phosphate guanylyltransferase [Terriglobia bacterium]|nr:MAG: bifunctional adenosylcobinamide kinase/adenosylcobinamide-phosphate guanylyltransferase [Terriglobia bacterium]
MLTLIIGGTKSGKSRLAQRLAARSGRVCYVATAVTGDDPEMQARIERHRADRPASWQTIEEPLALADAVRHAAALADTIVVDCLTLWLSNLSWNFRDTPARVEEAAHTGILQIAALARSCHIILVSNELGCGTVPGVDVTRAFRDTQGLVNQWAGEAADEVILTVAGLPLYLKTPQREGAAAPEPLR